jgi:hypothetical protein
MARLLDEEIELHDDSITESMGAATLHQLWVGCTLPILHVSWGEIAPIQSSSNAGRMTSGSEVILRSV